MAEEMTLFKAEKADKHWESIAKKAIESCPKIKKEREIEILVARFGIGGTAKTLNSVGNKYGITRERIRQIVNNSIAKIKNNCSSKETALNIKRVEEIVRENGGFASFSDLAKRFTNGEVPEKNAFRFVASLSKKLEYLKPSRTLEEGWRDKSIKISEIKEIGKQAVDVLKKKNKTLSLEEIAQELSTDSSEVKASLSANMKLMADDKGKWGLVAWPHLNPKSIRDKSKYVIKRHGEPIHYKELAKKIGELGNKQVTDQSVHNELIKNKDFVLVGRGIYALTEWGYQPGVVEEVIVTVLKDSGTPLHKDVIIEKVLEKRIVKPSTIVLNLQRKRFKRVGKATYTLN